METRQQARGATDRVPWVAVLTKGLRFKESGILMALLIMIVALSVASPNFRSSYNLVTITKQFSLIAVVAIGQTMVIVTAGIDLSQGVVAGLSAVLSGLLVMDLGVPPAIAILIGVGIGAFCGFINGLLVTRMRAHPMVLTLGTMTAFSGINYVVSRGNPIINLPEGFLWLGKGVISLGRLEVPVPILLLVVVGLTLHLVLLHTVFGRRVYLVGSNPEAARLAGVNNDQILIGTYVFAGFLAALGGIAFAGRLGNIVPAIGSDWLLPVIAASVIGGTLLSGGEGSVLGTVIGAAIMGVITNALVILRLNIYYQNVALGLAILFAILVDQFRQGKITLASLLRGGR
jgi:ribose transport system permease protein